MKISFTIIFLFFSVSNIFGQGGSLDAGVFQEFKKMPVTPSPNASSLGKFGEIPISMSSGLPGISIPFYLFSDKTKNIDVKVSLNYHAGGHKVEDMASNTGLGWALNAGGLISRTMRGRPDDGPNGYLNTGNLQLFNTSNFDSRNPMPGNSPISQGVTFYNSNQFFNIRDISEGQLDGECDIFNINIGNLSGKFFFKKNGDIQLISQNNFKITYTFANSGQLNINEFIVTDGNGVKYIFNQKETTISTSVLGTLPASPSYTSAWYIQKIISADDTDEIQFTYNTGSNLFYEAGFSESYRSAFIPLQGTSVEMYSWERSSFTQSYNIVETLEPKRIASIIFPDGSEINFVYAHQRQDYAGDYALTEIKVKANNLEKKFLLDYGYFESDFCANYNNNCTPGLQYSPNNYYKRLKLLSVKESDGALSLAPYTFEYNPAKLPVRNCKRQDWWGFYNGIGGDGSPATSSTTAPYTPQFMIYSGDRPPSLEHAKAWVLDKIFYPTGGNTRFHYELNDGFKGTVYKKIGGLRVAKTVDYEPSTQKTIITKYTYLKTDNTSSGTLQTIPMHTAYWTTTYYNTEFVVIPNYYYVFNLNETLQPSQTLSYFNGSPVIYSRVKVEKSDVASSIGYTIYEYMPFAGVAAHDELFPFIQKQDFEWQQGLLTKELHYSSNSQLMKSIENEYQEYTYQPIDTNASSLSRNIVAGLLYNDMQGTALSYIYGARAYYFTWGRAEITKTTERIYTSPAVYLENITEYTYNGQYFVPILVKTKTSSQETIEKRLYYPFDYTSVGLTSRTALLNANRIAETVSEETWKQKGSVLYLTGAQVKNYTLINTIPKQNRVIAAEIPSPLNQSTVGIFNPNSLTRHSSFVDQILYSSFDSRGRQTDIQLKGQDKVSLLWGKSNSYPVCAVKNASTTQISYTSFEEGVNHNWQNVNQGQIVNTKGVTGLKHYQLTALPLTTVGVSASVKYIVSYWSKNGAYSVTGTQVGWPKTGKTTIISGQSWTYYEHLVTGNTSISISAVGSGAIDELRLYPESSEISTVAYNVLTGITEQADTGGNILYYEYDSFFRLTLVKDYQGNIIKKICYNYQNQPQDCSGITNSPQWQPTGLVNCKPCTANPSFLSDQQERQEKDMNPLSPTYNSLRWVNTGTSSSCVATPVWQNSSSTCEIINGNSTGNNIITQTDINPCSLTYNQTRTVIELNKSLCYPAGCTNCYGADKKCVFGVCETGIKIYTSSVYNPATYQYECTYHYEFSDGYWSQDYVEYSAFECLIN